MVEVPFPEHRQLCSDLYVAGNPHRLMKIAKPPEPTTRTTKPAEDNDWLPGHPWLRLRDDDATFSTFLTTEIVTDDLNKLAPYMWLLSTPKSSSIWSLRHQIVQGRQIVVTEDPGHHLTWIYERAFVKPIPEYLLSYAFWKYYLVSTTSPIPAADRDAILRGAKGFLRSYAFLIQHKSDYLLATSDGLELVPKSVHFADLVEFLRCFSCIPDEDVSPRYTFGDLRLTRINFWVKIFLRRSYYFRPHGQYGAYFAQYYGPLLFVFGVVAVALNSMQVVLAVGAEDGPNDTIGWWRFGQASQWFSVFMLCVTLLLCLFLLSDLLFLVLREVIFATKHRFGKKAFMSTEGGWDPAGSDSARSGRAAGSNV